MMGDAGALFLGVLLAVPTITIGGRTDHAFSGNTFFFFGPLLIPVVILGVPILDTVFSFVRRLVRSPALASGRRRPPASPPHAPRSRPAPHGRDPVGVDRAALGRRAVPDLHATRATRSCPSSSPRSRCCCSRGSTPASAPAGSATSGARHPPAHPGDDVVDLEERRRQAQRALESRDAAARGT